MASIPLAINPPAQPQGPIQQAQGALSVQALINQDALQKQAQQANVVQQQQRQQELQQQQIATQEQQMQFDDTQKFNKAFRDAGGDWNKAIDLATQYGASGQFITKAQLARTDMLTKASALTKDQLSNELQKQNELGVSAQKVLDAPDDQKDLIYAQERNQHLLSGAYQSTDIPDKRPPDLQLEQLALHSKSNQDLLKEAQDLQKSKADTAEAQAKATISQQEAQMTPEQRARLKLLGEPTALEMSDWLTKNPGKGPADYMKYKATLVPQFNFNLQGGPGGGLSDPALDQAANRYLTTGQLPAMGMGAAGAQARKAIMNRAGQLDPNGVISANEAVQKANTISLSNIQKQFDSVNAFENTAIKNLDRLVVNGQQIPDLGARFANVPVRMIDEKMIGTPAMARFKADLLTAQNESAKVLNSANATGVLSDSARREAQEILSGNLPFPAMVAAVNELKNDMGNRHQAYQDQIADIQGRLRQQPGTQTPAAPSPATAAPTGGHIIQLNGKRYQYSGNGDTADIKNYKELPAK